MSLSPAISEAQVAIVMGSSSDGEVMQQAARQLHDFGAAFDARVISAYCSPEILFRHIKDMAKQSVQCFSAGTVGAAHLAEVSAEKTTLPSLI